MTDFLYEHTTDCWAAPECDVCHRRKKPFGRDAGLAAANGFCDSDCEGYDKEPRAGHFWPNEEPELLAAIRKREVDNPQTKENDMNEEQIEIEDDQRCSECGSTEAGNCFYCQDGLG